MTPTPGRAAGCHRPAGTPARFSRGAHLWNPARLSGGTAQARSGDCDHGACEARRGGSGAVGPDRDRYSWLTHWEPGREGDGSPRSGSEGLQQGTALEQGLNVENDGVAHGDNASL